MISSTLYAQIIRAISLDDELSPSPKSQQSTKIRHFNPSSGHNQSYRSHSFELVEFLRKLVNFENALEHEQILRDVENCVNYTLKISIECPTPNTKFLLQISRIDDRTTIIDEHTLISTGSEKTETGPEEHEIKLPHGQRSILRLFPVDSSSRSDSPPITSVTSSNSAPSSPSSKSTASSNQIDQIKSSKINTKISQDVRNYKCPMQKSSSFLKKWVRSHGRVSPCLTVKIKNLLLNEEQLLVVPGITPPVTAKLTLKKTFTFKEPFQPIDICEFVTMLRAFKKVMLKDPIVDDSIVSDEEHPSHEADEITGTSQHFDSFHEKWDVMSVLDEICERVARFNNFSPLAGNILFIGVALEDLDFDNQLTYEYANIIIQRKISNLHSKHISSSESSGEILQQRLELSSALFLAERLITVTNNFIHSQKLSVFFPVDVENEHRSNENSNGLTDFEAFCGTFLPLVSLIQLDLWTHPEVNGFPGTITRLFDQAIQNSMSAFLRVNVSEESKVNKELDGFCELIDSIHLSLRKFLPIYEAFFERLSISYTTKIIQTIDYPLFIACQNCLDSAIDSLNSRNKDELILFAKSSMKLFDAIAEFTTFMKQFSVKCSLYEFESLFERSAVFWSTSWRTLYMDFIRKSVEECENEVVSKPKNSISNKGSILLLESNSPNHQHIPDFGNIECYKKGIQIHGSTFNCLAFCKSLCDDFMRLRVRNPSILLLGTLQVTAILVDCLGSFVVQIIHQMKKHNNLCQMLKTANAIEHASSHLSQNFERFLEIDRLNDVIIVEVERAQALASIRHMMSALRGRCRAISDKIVEGICERKQESIRRYCSLITKNWADATRMNWLCPFRRFTNEPADQLLVFLDKTCSNLHNSLLPRLYSTAKLALWQQTRNVMENQLLTGQHPEYYGEIDKACESICHILHLNWTDEQSALRRKIHVNRAETTELILQYYSRIADLCINSRPKATAPRICLRAGYINSTNRRILLHIHVLSAYDVPILDSLTQSSDPYLRLELYPHCFFPLDQYPAQNTETKKETLNPKWNQIFQIAIPEELFFKNGVCLCLTVLDYDHLSYNDLAGQALLPLASLPKMKELSTKNLSTPLVLPLLMPNIANYNTEAFKILEQRSVRDEVANQMTKYEKYLRDYHILPLCAQDEKEWTVQGGITLAKSRLQLKRTVSNLFSMRI